MRVASIGNGDSINLASPSESDRFWCIWLGMIRFAGRLGAFTHVYKGTWRSVDSEQKSSELSQNHIGSYQ